MVHHWSTNACFAPLLDLDEIRRNKRTERQCRQAPAYLKRAEVDREVADRLQNLADLGLRSGVIAGVELDALAARHFWLRKNIHVQMVEGLDDACAGNELTEDFA